MTTQCLICDSTAVLSKDASNALVIVITTLDNILLGVNWARAQGAETNPNAH